MTDRQLLERFAGGDPAAFEELAHRHAGWIYSAAFRQLHNSEHAEDAAQAVFLVLVRKARTIPASVHIAGWLYRTTILASKEIARREARQKRREEQAAMLRPEPTTAENQLWNQVAPVLERIMNRLRQRDREAILLRFYAQRSYADVAAEMGIGAEAARKRVERAIEKLRHLLAEAQIREPSDLLGASLLIHAGAAGGAHTIAQIARQSFGPPARQLAGVILGKLAPIKLGMIGAAVGVAAMIVAGVAVVRSSPSPVAPPASTDMLGPVTNLRPATISLNDFIAHVRAAETQIKNVHIVHFKTTMEERNRNSPAWQRMPSADEGSAWFDGTVGGKARVYFKHHVMDWSGGGAHGWIDESIDTGFDGHEGRTIRFGTSLIKRGSDGKFSAPPQTPDRYVMVDGKPPIDWGGRFIRYITGVALTPQYTVMDGEDSSPAVPRDTVSQAMAAFERSLGKNCRIFTATINGIDAIGFVYRGSSDKPVPINLDIEYWFDPHRGYAIVRYGHQYQINGDMQRLCANATAWTEAAPGIWFPTDGVCESSTGSRFTYHADKVVVNDPKFRNGIFLPALPVGFIISDRRTNRTSIIEDDGETIDLHRGDAVPAVKPDVPKPPKD